MRRRITGGQTVATGSLPGGNTEPDPRAVAFLPNPQAKLRDQVATTQIYTHVMQKPGWGVRSPLDHISPLNG